MHAKIENGLVTEYPITNLRQRFPNKSLPADLTNDSLLPEGFVYVRPGISPEYDPSTHTIVAGEPIQDIDGQWAISYKLVPLTEEELAHKRSQSLQRLKDARHQEVRNIVVTTSSGKQFDGNEEAQNRMGRAVSAMDDADTVSWVLADNTVAPISRAELKEALKLAGMAMAKIWVRPYQQPC